MASRQKALSEEDAKESMLDELPRTRSTSRLTRPQWQVEELPVPPPLQGERVLARIEGLSRIGGWAKRARFLLRTCESGAGCR
jgi:hypothetical protein